MIVDLKPHNGRCLRTGKPIRIPQDRIFVDGEAVGYLAHKPGSKICLIRRFSPWEVAEIEKQISVITNDERRSTSMVPEVPEHMLEQKEDEIDINDID